MAPAASPRDALFAGVGPALGLTPGDRNLIRTPFVSIASRLRQVARSRAALWQEYVRLHKVVVATVRRDELCRRFMRIPGIGPINALAYKTSIDDPQRFRRSKTVGAYLGLTSRRWQSGTSIDVQGHISKAGDGDVRHPLYEAANIMLTRYRGFCSLKAWGLKIAKKRGHKRACVAVARKLAVIMHAMWRDGSEFRFKEPKASTDRTAAAAPKLIGTAA